MPRQPCRACRRKAGHGSRRFRLPRSARPMVEISIEHSLRRPRRCRGPRCLRSAPPSRASDYSRRIVHSFLLRRISPHGGVRSYRRATAEVSLRPGCAAVYLGLRGRCIDPCGRVRAGAWAARGCRTAAATAITSGCLAGGSRRPGDTARIRRDPWGADPCGRVRAGAWAARGCRTAAAAATTITAGRRAGGSSRAAARIRRDPRDADLCGRVRAGAWAARGCRTATGTPITAGRLAGGSRQAPARIRRNPWGADPCERKKAGAWAARGCRTAAATTIPAGRLAGDSRQTPARIRRNPRGANPCERKKASAWAARRNSL